MNDNSVNIDLKMLAKEAAEHQEQANLRRVVINLYQERVKLQEEIDILKKKYGELEAKLNGANGTKELSKAERAVR